MAAPFSRQYPLVILGAGYTGIEMFRQATRMGWNALATSRRPQIRLSQIPASARVQFDLTLPETWKNIPDPAHLIWCFPTTPFDLVTNFLAARATHGYRLLVTGSTSAYVSDGHPITEDSCLDPDAPRVRAEEYLRTTYGAIIIRLAGIYGPGRHVLDWIRKGKIQNSRQWVNLIHVEDAAALCLQALEQAPNGSTYLASDGVPRTWEEICSVACSKWQVPIPPPAVSEKSGKQVSIHKLHSMLSYTFRYPDLYHALDVIETYASPSHTQE